MLVTSDDAPPTDPIPNTPLRILRTVRGAGAFSYSSYSSTFALVEDLEKDCPSRA